MSAVLGGKPARWSWLIAGLLFACISLVYLPGLTRVFEYHDSFLYFSYLDRANCAANPQAAYIVFTGRPLFMLINCGVATLMNTVSDAQVIRVIGIAILSGTGVAIVGALRAYGVHTSVAFGAVVGLLSVPGWQLVLSMSQAAALVWSLPPVVGAFFLVRHIIDAESLLEPRARWSFIGAVALVLIASLTYQQNTSILFSLCAVPVVLSPLGRSCRMLLWAVTVYAVSGFLYLLIHRLIVLPLVLPAMGVSADRFDGMAASVLLSTDLLEKARYFGLLTPRALALWFLDPPTAVPLIVGLVVAAAAIGTFWRDLIESRTPQQTRATWWPAFQRLALIALLIPLSVAPVLVARGGLVVYRHIVPYQWLIILLIVATATRFATTRRSRGVLVAATLTVTVVAGFYSNWNFDRNLARINEKELEFIQAELANGYKKLPTDVVVIQPDATNLGDVDASFIALADEFGKTSTMYPQDVPWVVYGAAIEMGLPRERVVSVSIARLNPATGQLQVLDNEGKVRYEGPLEGSIVIDMREFAAQVRRGEF